MSSQVACLACGALIQEATASRTGGLCMPCKNGGRKKWEESVARSKAADAELKAARESPAGRHWAWLVASVYQTPEGFNGLSLENRKFFAAQLVAGDVDNGGFDQYFGNSSGDYYDLACETLSEVGAFESLSLLTRAKQVLFGESAVPATTAERRALLRGLDESASRSKSLEDLDRQFWKDPDGLRSRLDQYAQTHKLDAGF